MTWLERILAYIDTLFVTPQPLPIIPAPMPPTPLPVLEPEVLKWDTPKHAFHSTRVLCDEIGLTYQQKNILCACIFQESRFDNRAVGKNPNSTDFGIVQINDHYNIGKGKMFPSVNYVVANPEVCVRWMIRIMKTTGKLQPWASFTSGAYQQWLPLTSPMWNLKEV